MREEQTTYKITCDECGYSEIVSRSRLSYEEGKTCPVCFKGKMYWVPPAEEARRRRFWETYRQGGKTMPEEQKISPAVIIPIGLGFGLAVLIAFYTFSRAAPPAPEGYTCPVCGEVFSTPEELQYHLTTEHPPVGINILGITGQKQADGSIVAYIQWTHHGLPRWWWDPAYTDSAYSFIEAITSVGRMENGTWRNYYTVAVRGSIPREDQVATATAYWAAEAVAQMPKGPAGFQCHIEAFTIGWQTVAVSPTYTAEDVIII